MKFVLLFWLVANVAALPILLFWQPEGWRGWAMAIIVLPPLWLLYDWITNRIWDALEQIPEARPWQKLIKAMVIITGGLLFLVVCVLILEIIGGA